MSKEAKKKWFFKKTNGPRFVKERGGIKEYCFEENGLTLLYKKFPDTGIVTTNITYRVGSRDENVGETGLAHMLEHMLFKPTKGDLRRKTESGAMLFERDTGCILNANTWKDRTTYFFSYPKEHLKRALQIEAERMDGVVLTDAEFLPERGNVLSEFDMYFGEPKYALDSAMVSVAFQSHPYGHETIGFREDIESYTVEKLETFYRQHYRPDNAVLMVMGDISEETALREVTKAFGNKRNPKTSPLRRTVIEPKQEGIRRTEIARDSHLNLLAIGIKHAGFPSKKWLETAALFYILCGSSDGILNKLLVDTGLASSIDYSVEPGSETGLGIIRVTLAKKIKHDDVERMVLDRIRGLKESDLENGIKKATAVILTEEAYSRDGSLRTVMSLTEDVAAGDWTSYFETRSKLKKITATSLIALTKELFVDSNLTIGRFIGTK